ncbi:MAG: pyridoxamine 5'-phosphate oxidase family protein, partial [Treponemataceae bacterium]|nr:pyridoxamine 5'-phosphate oxidase family protein [Treponemataceae bacterium]
MFRPMRRPKQALAETECHDILLRGKTAVVSLMGDDGYPYGVPVNYLYRDGKLYFHCATAGHKMDALKSNPKVSVCVIDADEVDVPRLATSYKSVIMFGKARLLETDEEKLDAIRAFAHKFSDNTEQIEEEIVREWNGLAVVEISIEHLTGKRGIYV